MPSIAPDEIQMGQVINAAFLEQALYIVAGFHQQIAILVMIRLAAMAHWLRLQRRRGETISGTLVSLRGVESSSSSRRTLPHEGA